MPFPKGKKHTQAAIAKMGASQTGRKHPAATRAKISAALKAHKRSAEHCASLSRALCGRTFDAEWCAKISAGNAGKRRSAEQRARYSAARTGCKHSPEAIAKMSAAKRGKYAGAGNPRWRGGISLEPYAWTFNAELKEEVRRRDGYKCQLCDVPQAECDTALPVHHIDYNKKDSDPVNLVALCHHCHSRTNARREYWTAFFQAMALKRAIAGIGGSP